MSILSRFKKKEPATIEFWSTVAGIENIAPPELAIKCLPDWIKTMPGNHEGAGRSETARQCPAFVDYFKQGYVLKLWCDLKLDIREDGSYFYETPNNQWEFSNHGNQQYIDYMPQANKYSMVLKAMSPWRMRTTKGWSVMQLPMFYNYNNDFEVLPGIFDTDIHFDTTPQLCFHKYGVHYLERGTPLCMFVPFKREEIKGKISPLTTELINVTQTGYQWWAGKFKGGYREHQKFLKGELK